MDGRVELDSRRPHARAATIIRAFTATMDARAMLTAAWLCLLPLPASGGGALAGAPTRPLVRLTDTTATAAGWLRFRPDSERLNQHNRAVCFLRIGMAVPRLLLKEAPVLLLLAAVGTLPRGADEQLSAGFYSASCPAFASRMWGACPASGGDDAAAPLDAATPREFDNGYYRNLVAGAGLLHSDQELFNNGPLDALVRLYSANGAAFSSDFAASMVRLGNVGPLTGSAGEVRLDCRKVNSS